MVRFKTGDLLAEDAEALVNTVNCVGVMGRGIALQFKKEFHENFLAYSKACKDDEVRPGRMFVFETHQLANPRYIVNFPTKRHWRGNSRMEDVEAGLRDLVDVIRKRNIRSIAIPPLASGLGGLAWDEVRPRIEESLRSLDDLGDRRIVIFEPYGAPEVAHMVRKRKVPKMTPARAVLVGLMRRYLNGLLDPFVTLLEVHKLMYFMQLAGEPLKLRYAKGLYGPYAKNLRHLLHEVEGHFISGYADGGDAPDKPLELVPGAVEDAAAFLESSAATRQRFDRVTDLIEGFESDFGLELLSTVHWVVAKEQPRTFDEVAARVYAWNQRKKQFSLRQLRIAVEVLSQKGWIDAAGIADDTHPALLSAH